MSDEDKNGWNRVLFEVVANTLQGTYIRDFTKWYFDLIKNIIVVATLSLIASKSKSAIATIISTFSYVILLLYLFTYSGTARIPRSGRKLDRPLIIANVVAGITAAIAIVYLPTFFKHTVDQLVSNLANK